MKKIRSILVLLPLIPSLAMAGDLKVDFEFLKRAPSVAIIYADDKGAKSDEFVDQLDKKFIRRAYVIAPKNTIEFKNSDVMDHNIYANAPKSGVKFDIGLLPPGSTANIDNSHWQEDTVVRIGCKIHPKMKTYLANMATSASMTVEFNKKDKSYSQVLTGINSSTQKFAIWMPGYAPIKVALAKGETKTFDMLKKSKKKGTVTLSY